MKIFSRFVLAGAALLASAVASYSQFQNMSGRGMMDRVIAALGGDAFLHMRNRMATGRIYGFFHDRLSGLEIATIYVSYGSETAPGKLAITEREWMGKKRDYSYLFLADRGFELTYRGARPIAQEDWDRYVRNSRNDILYILRCRLNEPGMQFDYVGSDVLIGRHVEILDVTDATGFTIRVYLDHNTLLPIHETYTWFDEQTREHNDESVDFDKYRDMGNGIQWPWVIEREHNGYKSYQMYTDNGHANVDLPPGTFDLPEGVKMLKAAE